MDLNEMDAHLQDLTPHQKKIVQVIYDGGADWQTRSNVARELGKRRLTPYDIDCLKMLTDKGLIETSTQPTNAPGSDFAYIYHMPDDIAHTLQKWSELREKREKERQRKPINLVRE